MTLNKAFLCLLFVLSTLFPVNFAFAGTSYTDLASFESAVGASTTEIDLVGTPSSTVSNGTVFSGVSLYGYLPMQFNSTGTQVCLVPDGIISPRFDITLPNTTSGVALEFSGTTTLEFGSYDISGSDYAYYVVSPTFTGAGFDHELNSIVVIAYGYSDALCVGPLYMVSDADADGYAADLDCDDTTSSVSPAVSESCDGIDNDCDGIIDEGFDVDGDGFTTCAADCDDTNFASYPGATEIEDGLDNDCDGVIDEGTNAYDDDDDGYNENAGDCNDAEASISPAAAEVPYNGVDEDCNSATPDDDLDGDSYVLASDCDDTNSGMNPGEVEVAYDGIDNDCSATTSDDDIDGDGYNLADDCDDTNSGINPGASEVAYDGIDQDCDGADLDDVDGDGSAYPDDCNDSNSRVYPGAAETCNGRDENCDGLIDEGYADSDGDGNADCVDEDLDGDTYTPTDGDCDDTDAAINPAATDIPDNGIDEDCSGEDLTDADSDGYGTADGDCDDSDASISPAATETCDGIDQDCDGAVDENPTDGSTWYADSDADTYGNSGSTVISCTQPTGYVSNDSDCDDHNNTVYPGAEDVPDDGIDQDCDGSDATTPVDTGDTGGDSGDSGGVIDTGDSGTDTAVDDTAGGDTAGTKIKIATGCGCDSGPGFGPGLAWLVGLALLIRRRS